MSMNFYSTKNQTEKVSLKEAVLHGLAPDGGLFMPNKFSPLNSSFFDQIFSLSLPELALEVSKHLLKDEIPKNDLENIIEHSISFDAPLIPLSEEIYVLELFHGPTLSFKDFGARFMASLLNYFNRNQDRNLNILTATSGDTGSAVAHAFLDIPGINVWILYPKGQVSMIQEKQLTTIGKNVTALEIEGSFDDCQTLVKQAFNDKELCQKMRLTSANSINIARLIPQSFYYFYAYAQLKKKVSPIVISVPSGNFGNLTAGLFAKKIGLPIDRFIGATNANDSVPQYLRTGHFNSHPSKQTLSNAMDVGNPSNFARILDLYRADLEQIRKDLWGVSFTDFQTEGAIRELDQKYDYLADPHGAIGYLGLLSYPQNTEKTTKIFLETAHPAKFLTIVEPLVKKKIDVPSSLQKAIDKNKEAITLSNNYDHLKMVLTSGK
jgi:threonine synthase